VIALVIGRSHLRTVFGCWLPYKKIRVSSPLLVFRERQKPVVKGFISLPNRPFFKKSAFSKCQQATFIENYYTNK
jgi:hypothetical protein